ARGDGPRQLDLGTAIRLVDIVRKALDRRDVRRRRLLTTGSDEEPQPVFHDRTTGGQLVGVVDLSGVRGWRRLRRKTWCVRQAGAAEALLPRSESEPAVAAQVVAQRRAEVVAAALGDDVEHAAGEV